MLMTRHKPHLDSAPDWLKQNFPRDTTNQKHYAYLGSDKSSVWNFCSRSSDVTRQCPLQVHSKILVKQPMHESGVKTSFAEEAVWLRSDGFLFDIAEIACGEAFKLFTEL